MTMVEFVFKNVIYVEIDNDNKFPFHFESTTAVEDKFLLSVAIHFVFGVASGADNMNMII